MQHKSVGTFLGDVRRRQRRTLHHVAKRVGRKGISKQALSLIERGRMRVPMARLDSIRRAYRMSMTEERELAELFAFEKLIESTGEDREFGEAVLSVLDLKTASSIYVIGGRKLALTSPVLQAKAATFLEGAANMLAFFYLSRMRSCGFTTPNMRGLSSDEPSKPPPSDHSRVECASSRSTQA
jgi:transcriptional regulator with XRE-family HTH domain